MDGIVKIVIALKLKFLLIILSVGTSYFIEQRHKKQEDPVSAIELVRPDTGLASPGNIDTLSLSKVADKNKLSPPGSGDRIPVLPVNHVASRPLWYQGLEIYIAL